MSEALRNDGRVWGPKKAEDCGKNPNDIPEADRDYYLERKYPSFGNLAPRDISSRSAKEACDEGRGVGPGGPTFGVSARAGKLQAQAIQRTVSEHQPEVSTLPRMQTGSQVRGVGGRGRNPPLNAKDSPPALA